MQCMFPYNLPAGQALYFADGREIYIDHDTTWTSRRGWERGGASTGSTSQHKDAP